MYIEIIITIQTFIIGLYTYIYISERQQKERIIKSIGCAIAQEIIDYLSNLNMNLDMTQLNLILQMLVHSIDKNNRNHAFNDSPAGVE